MQTMKCVTQTGWFKIVLTKSNFTSFKQFHLRKLGLHGKNQAKSYKAVDCYQYEEELNTVREYL